MILKEKAPRVSLSMIFLWLPQAGSFEVETPLPKTVTLSQPFTFAWHRDQSDLSSASAYIQFAASCSGTITTESVVKVGESKSGTYTMIPMVPGVLAIDGWSGYSPSLDEDSRDRYFELLPQTLLVQTLQTSESSTTQIETPSSPPSQTQESPAQTPTKTENGSGTTSLPEGFQTTSSPSSVFMSGSGAPPAMTSDPAVDTKGSSHTGAITGGVVGGLSAITIMAALLFYIRRRQQL
ncbi:hypothetical protein PQX77_020202, partial [Marasmius sp. AFHP31]